MNHGEDMNASKVYYLKATVWNVAIPELEKIQKLSSY
jgi:hypothetical protein